MKFRILRVILEGRFCLVCFCNCPNITSITCYATRVPVCSPEAFYGLEKDSATVYVPKGTVDAYKAADGWSLAAPQRGINIVRMSDGTVKKVIVK
jgi:hypothetical protein